MSAHRIAKFVALTLLALPLLSAPAVAAVVSPASDEQEGPEHGKINSPDATPVDPGHFEAEAIYSYNSANRSWNNNGDGTSRGLISEHAAEFSFTAGLINNLDVAVSSSYNWLHDKDNDFDGDGNTGPTTGDAIGDLDVRARYRFIQSEAYNLDVAYIGGLTIPTGTRSGDSRLGTSQEYWSLNQTVVASKDWGKWTANIDAGFALPFGDRKGAARGTFNSDLAGGYQALPWLQPELELNYSRDFISAADDSEVLAVTAGLVMPISERLRINTGIQQAFWGRNTDKTTTYSLAAKVAF
ncbi:MAG: transporter [Bdellovibrionales bacterium]